MKRLQRSLWAVLVCGGLSAGMVAVAARAAGHDSAAAPDAGMCQPCAPGTGGSGLGGAGFVFDAGVNGVGEPPATSGGMGEGPG